MSKEKQPLHKTILDKMEIALTLIETSSLEGDKLRELGSIFQLSILPEDVAADIAASLAVFCTKLSDNNINEKPARDYLKNLIAELL